VEPGSKQAGTDATAPHLPGTQATAAVTPANNHTLHGKAATGNKKIARNTTPFTISNKNQPRLNSNLGAIALAGNQAKNKTNRAQQTRSNSHNNNTADDQPASNLSTPPATNTTATARNSDNVVTENTTTIPNTPPNTAPAAPGNPAVTQPAATDSTQQPTAQPVKKDNHKNTPSVTQHWEIGLVAGPDASTVEFGPLYKPGYNFGVQIGYRITNRWSVNAGAIYTK